MKYSTKYLGYIAIICLSGCANQEEQHHLHVQPRGALAVAQKKSATVKTSSAEHVQEKAKVVREKDIIWDPLEPWNRSVFIFNQGVEHVFWEPILTVYRYLIPPFAQNTVHNVLEHVKGPVSIISSALQGDREKTMTHFARFMCNTIFGLGGLVDIASDVHIEADNEDLGKTMKAYDVPPGCFVMIPFLGPTVSRDAVGRVCGLALYGCLAPGTLVSFGTFGAENLNQRLIFKDSIDHVLEYSSDPYAMIRRAYYESRGELPDTSTQEDVEDEDQDA
jgi:phospholipid-binding lipoprotein MlaA